MLPYALLTASLAANGYFALLYVGNNNPVRRPSPHAVQAGVGLPPIEAASLDGVPTIVTCPREKRGTVVYIFTPQCHWCDENTANVNVLARYLKDDYSFVGLSLSEQGVREYIRSRELSFTVLIRPSRASRSAYQLRSTPMTYLLSPHGVVVDSWVGAYAGETLARIERRFGVRLPGLPR